MSQAEMTSLQRVLTTLGHREPDRVPFFLLVTMHGAKELGLSIKEYFSKAENVVEGQLRLLEEDHRKLESNRQQYQQLQLDHQYLQSKYQFASEQNTMMLDSSSWKITRPLRAGRRVLQNLSQARVWNPARWPL